MRKKQWVRNNHHFIKLTKISAEREEIYCDWKAQIEVRGKIKVCVCVCGGGNEDRVKERKK